MIKNLSIFAVLLIAIFIGIITGYQIYFPANERNLMNNVEFLVKPKAGARIKR